MPVKYIPYVPETTDGQAILDNFTRSRRILRYRDNNKVIDRIKRGLPLYEVEETEKIGEDSENLLLRGECLSACAYLKDKGIKVDLVYIDPPFASGADYARKVYLRKNPKIAEKLAEKEAEIQKQIEAGEEVEIDEYKAFEEKMYGDIWHKEEYLNWMYENLTAIRSIMSEKGCIFVHLDWHIGHYVKILLDEIFGEDNFINQIIVNRGRRKNLQSQFEKISALSSEHDFIYLYSVNPDKLFNHVRSKSRASNAQWQSFWRGNVERTSMQYEILGFKPNGGQLLWSEKRGLKAAQNYLDFLESGETDLEEYWIKTGKSLEFVRVTQGRAYPEYWISPKEEGIIGDVWLDIQAYSYSNDYSTEKHEDLLSRIVKMVANDEEIVVADFFGGSGVTASVAHKLGKKFVSSDVGINALLTTRDRLFENKANFKILNIKDGVSLFRNPIQTMDNLKKIIVGLRNEDKLDSFWEGAIEDSKDGLMPVYIPNLLDHSTKVLDIPLMNRILNEAMPDLPEDVKKVIVYYIDIEDREALDKFISAKNETDVKIELRDLKEILDEVVLNDVADYDLRENENGFEIEFNNFVSDRLTQKIEEYNQKRKLQHNKKDLLEISEETEETATSKKAKFKPLEISENGLELIEFVSLDCTNQEGVWKSDIELKIDKNSFVILNGEKKKEFWNGKILSDKKPLRMKIRNIAGDESILKI